VVSLRESGGNRSLFADVDRDDPRVRMRPRPRLDKRQLELARLAPTRVKIQEQHAAVLAGNAKDAAVQPLVDRCRRRMRAGPLKRARGNEDLPDCKADDERR
jgi:hypothetical protein